MTKAITLEEVGVSLKEVGEMLTHVVSHIATKEDLGELEERLTNKIEGVDSRLDTVEKRLSVQIQALDSRFGAHENHELDKRNAARSPCRYA
ncbi:MAG TPA: hypothetical protein VMU13_00730 [Candidatus Paceibacterota bacterium]|nr:hypothetical protein [Candidatus Paceibacterota bacterium]